SNFFFKAALRACSCSFKRVNSFSLSNCSLSNFASFSALACSKGLKGSYVLSAFVVGLFSTEFKE
ncbi:hypothetical protein, partial [Helicobacter pylori]|uniref:hypothetical protein n=1 Tax=Helicobacter pylori TaxID=210 RepID=UPI003C788B0E